MINVSTEFRELMKERTDFRCYAAMTLADGTETVFSAKDFAMGGNSVTDGPGAEGLPLGAAVCRTARLSLADPEGKLDGYDFYGAKLRLYLTFALSETEERVELGSFTVTEGELRGETVTVTAADDMHRADRAYTTALSFPATLGAMFREICDGCGIPYSTAEFPNSGFAVASAPGEGYTCRQVLGYIAMLAGGNARVHRDGRMEILSYDPERAPEHDLADWITLTPDTDDVTVTGLETTDSEGETVLEGSEGYVLAVDDPLMAGQEAAALAAMGQRLIGLRVRRFQGEYIAYPLAEFMDTARITDRKGNAFTTVLTDVTFAFGGRTALSNSAASAARNASRYATPEAKARQAARQLVAAERTARQAAVQALNERLAKASGMYGTRQVQPDGSSVWYLHDKPELAQSQAVMKLTSEAIGFSTDGGNTYPFGFTVTGEMVMGIIRSEGISADWVKVGGEALGAVLEGFVGRDENDQIVSMLNASADRINIRGNRFVLDSDNFKVAADGTITAKNGRFSGRVTSSGTWPDGVHTLNIEDSRLEISIGNKRNLYVNQLAGDGGSIGGSYISVYYGDNDNGVLLDDDALKTDVVGKYINVGVDKNGTARGWINCGDLNAGGNINAGGNVNAEGSITAGNVKAERSITAGGSVAAGGSVSATCGKRRLTLIGGQGGTYEGLYSPELGAWLVTIDESKNVRLLGKADNATKADYVGHKLTFTGAATGSYDGSAAKTVNIPTVPTALKNPKALTFTGAATGSYDGSAAKTVNIPTVPTALKNPKALTFTGGATGSYDGSAAKSVKIPSALGDLSNGVWKAGSSINYDSVLLNGYITNSGKNVVLLFSLGRLIKGGVTAKVTKLNGLLRGVGGYVGGSSVFNLLSGATVSVVQHADIGQVQITVSKSAAFSGAVNNTPVAFVGAVTVSFAASSDEPMPGPEIFADETAQEGPSMEDGAEQPESDETPEKEVETV